MTSPNHEGSREVVDQSRGSQADTAPMSIKDPNRLGDGRISRPLAVKNKRERVIKNARGLDSSSQPFENAAKGLLLLDSCKSVS